MSAGTTYGAYLQKRWAEGDRDAAVQRAVMRWREEARPRGAAARKARVPASDVLPPLRPPSPHQAAWFLLKPLARLTAEQRTMRTNLLAAAPDLPVALGMIEDFRRWFGPALRRRYRRG